MVNIRRSVCVGFLSAIAFASGCNKPKPPVGRASNEAQSDPRELERLKGTWQVVAIEAAGQPVPADRIQKLQLQYIFDGNRVTIHRPDRPDNVNMFTVDATSSPKKMTIQQMPPVRAAYAVDGNKLRLCIMVDENPNTGYPTELASRPSPKTDLLTLERR